MLKKLFQHNVLKNAFALIGVQIANYIVPLLAWPLLAKSLGLEAFGSMMIVLAICAIALIITDFGFNISATYRIAQNMQDKPYIAQLLSNIFAIKFILAILTSIGVLIYYTYFMEHIAGVIDSITCILIILIVLAQAFQCIWFFQGIEKMGYMTKVNIYSKVGYVVVLFITFQFYQSVNIALFCFFITQLLMTILYIKSIYKEKYYITTPNWVRLGKEAKSSFSFFISRVAVSTYTIANTLLIGQFSGHQMAGLYGAAEKIYQVGTSASGIISQAIYPHMAKTKNLRLLFKILMLLLPIVLIGNLIISYFASDILALLFGEVFRDATKILQLFLVMLCISFFSVSIGYPGFAAIGRVHLANYTVIIGAVFHCIGLVVLFFYANITAENILKLTIGTESLILFLRIFWLLRFSKNN